MNPTELTEDQRKLIYLVSRKSRIEKDWIIWLKELALLTLVHKGIRLGVFKSYDYAPSLVVFHGVKLYANVSQEYLKDIEKLRYMGMLYKLKLNTKYYDNINAFTVATSTERVISNMSRQAKDEVDKLIDCPKCKGTMKVVVNVKSSTLLCPQCGYKEHSDLFTLENISYKCKAYFSGGGR